MPYIEKKNRDQMMFCCLASFVDENSEVRLIDAFVESLSKDVFDFGTPAAEGRPAYNPKDLLKLQIYGYRNDIRSSRKMANAAKVNVEVKWLIGDVQPDFRTIADFRKANIKQIKNVFKEFNKRIAQEHGPGYYSIDGSKFQANNSKDNNFTKSKLDDRIINLNAHIEQYMNALDTADVMEDSDENLTAEQIEVLEQKLKAAKERLAKYQSYQAQMEETGASQLSLTDPDSRIMKGKNGYLVAYNPQTAVDSETHMIMDYQMTNQVTDHGMLASTMNEIREERPGEVLEIVADKGYNRPEDMVECLEKGIIPHVIPDNDKEIQKLETTYEEATDLDPTSTEPEELKKCLRAGVIPEAYKDVLSDAEVVSVRRQVKKESEVTSIYGTEEEMRERAKQGYFVRDPERNQVYCPMGAVLRQKCVKKNGNIRYANKLACQKCPNRHRCKPSAGHQYWKEIDFTKDCLEKPCKTWMKDDGTFPEGKRFTSKKKFERIKLVRFTFKPDAEKTKNRMCLSEHPFGNIKRYMGASYFLLRGMEKVDGEFALFCLGYNLKRATNLLGFEKMMAVMQG